MLKKTKILICLTLVLMLAGASAYAAGFSASITADLDAYTVTYYGTSGDKPIKIVNAVVISGEGIPDDSNVVGIDSVFTEAGGAYSGKIYLSKNLPSGTYKAFVDSENGSASKRFIIIDEAASASYLAALNGKSTKAEFKAYLEANSEKFGIFSEDFTESFSFAADLLFAQKPSGGYASAKSVNKAFDRAAVSYEIKNSTDTAEALEKNAQLLGVDYAEYAALSQASKALLNELLKNADYEKADFSEIYEQNLIYAEIKSADRWTLQKEKILQYANRMGYTFSPKYNAILNKDTVFQTVFKEKDAIGGFGEIAIKLNSVIDKVYADEQKVAVTAGGGGGFVNTNPAVTPVKSGQLSDISGHWAKQYIDKLVENGGISGYEDGTFRPDNTITRAEFTKIIVSVFGISGSGQNGYSDVPSDAWYSGYIEKASANGIIYGSDGMFFPNSNITRQDAALIIYRVLKLKNIAMQAGNEFSDRDEIAEYAKNAVSEMTGAGIISGYDGNFMPRNSITRAEAATIIARAMELM